METIKHKRLKNQIRNWRKSHLLKNIQIIFLKILLGKGFPRVSSFNTLIFNREVMDKI